MAGNGRRDGTVPGTQRGLPYELGDPAAAGLRRFCPPLTYTRVPEEWEDQVRAKWRPPGKKWTPVETAIEVLRLEIEERYAPGFAEEEWNRRNEPRRCRWRKCRSRVVCLLTPDPQEQRSDEA